MGKILAICTSEKKGTQKSPVNTAKLIEDWGIEGDAHGGKWHRQVSLLSFEKIEDFRAKGVEVDFGAFGENLVVEGFDLSQIPVGSQFQIGEAVLELTQIAVDIKRMPQSLCDLPGRRRLYYAQRGCFYESSQRR